MVIHNPNITKVWLLEDSLWHTIQQLSAERFDVIIDLHHNLRTFFIKLFLNSKSYAFPKLNIEKWMLTTLGWNVLPKNLHLVDRYFAACKAIEVENDGLGLDYFLSEKDKVDVEKALPKGYSGGYVAWVIGAKHFTKILPPQKVIEAIKLIFKDDAGARIVLIGGKEDEQRGNEICAAFEGQNVFNVCGKFALNQSVSLVAQANVVVGNDTGLTQIAPAFGKKVVSVWGSTSVVFGVEPYFAIGRKKSIVVEVNNLACRPCTKFGRSSCPKGHLKCLNEIDAAEIALAVGAKR